MLLMMEMASTQLTTTTTIFRWSALNKNNIKKGEVVSDFTNPASVFLNLQMIFTLKRSLGGEVIISEDYYLLLIDFSHFC